MEITLDTAQKLLKTGEVVAVPTETVYGLAASLQSEAAIQKIFQLKGRPSDNPLIIHISEANQISSFAADIPDDFAALAKAFWPGPLALVIPVIPDSVPSIVRANLPTAAFRIPNHPIALALIRQSGPIVMPSANLSGTPSSTCRKHVEADFGDDFPVLDGDFCSKGVESTILIYQDQRWQIIRQGAIPSQAFLSILGYAPEILYAEMDKKPVCPGQKYRHYAPKAKLHLTQHFFANNNEVIVGFSDRTYPNSARFISLGDSSNPEFAAKNLYYALRTLDEEGIESALVDVNFPREGLWNTLWERLQKASCK